jgi:1-acyl-sn-glycerol-3-phosphate acyltransferase
MSFIARLRRDRPDRAAAAKGSLGYRAARALLTAPLRFAYRVKVEGADNLPGEGPVILAANHRSFMDSLFLALSSPRPIAFVAKAEYFDRRLTRWLFRGTGQIPVRRGSPSAAKRALAEASGVLASGGVLGIYPEGTRSRDGFLHRGNPGPAHLALTCGAPIIPVGLVGTEAVQGPAERLPRPFRTVTVRFGPARRVEAGGGATKTLVRGATDEVMQDIAVLCGQAYVDQYALVPSSN